MGDPEFPALDDSPTMGTPRKDLETHFQVSIKSASQVQINRMETVPLRTKNKQYKQNK